MLTLPHAPRWTRWLVIACGVLLLMWLSREDNRVWPVTLLGLSMTLLAITLRGLDHYGGRPLAARYLPVLLSLWGVLVGLGSSLTTASLMLLKSALHSHIVPDYPPGLMLAMLERAPIWALGGGLIGVALALGWLAVGTAQSPASATQPDDLT